MRLEKSQKEKLAIFQSIATALFSTEASKEAQGNSQQAQMASSSSEAVQFKGSFGHDQELKELTDVYIQFEDWAEDIDVLVDSINRLPGHTDKDISNKMGLLATDLKVWVVLF